MVKIHNHLQLTLRDAALQQYCIGNMGPPDRRSLINPTPLFIMPRTQLLL